MKKILCILILVVAGFTMMAQKNVSSARAKELFGERFISVKEAGLAENLEIPFPEEKIISDRISWLVPIEINGALSYRLYQPRYTLNDPVPSEIVSLAEAKKALLLINRLRPSFPNESRSTKPYKYFFRTKDDAPSKMGLEFKKTITYFDDELLCVNLPSIARAGVLDSKCVLYVIENEAGEKKFATEMLTKDDPPIVYERAIHILTLTYLK